MTTLYAMRYRTEQGKTAGLATGALGALVGAIAGQVSKAIPAVGALREAQPAAYDAILGGIAAMAADAVQGTPGQRPDAVRGDQAQYLNRGILV